MSRRPGLFSQFIGSVKRAIALSRQTDIFIGEDQHGNRYYEKPADPEKNLKQQRRVEPRDPDPFNVPEVPVEWMTWLQGRRPSPPSEKELLDNYVSMMKTKYRAGELQHSRGEETEDNTTKTHKGSNFPIYEGFETGPGKPGDPGQQKK